MAEADEVDSNEEPLAYDRDSRSPVVSSSHGRASDSGKLVKERVGFGKPKWSRPKSPSNSEFRLCADHILFRLDTVYRENLEKKTIPVLGDFAIEISSAVVMEDGRSNGRRLGGWAIGPIFPGLAGAACFSSNLDKPIALSNVAGDVKRRVPKRAFQPGPNPWIQLMNGLMSPFLSFSVPFHNLFQPYGTSYCPIFRVPRAAPARARARDRNPVDGITKFPKPTRS